MADERKEQQISADLVAQRGFASAMRGFDRTEVRAFLTRVATQLRSAADREHELLLQLQEAEQRAAHPELDEASLASAVGEETGRILRSAQEAATDIRGRAEDHAQRILAEAHHQAATMRHEGESILQSSTAEAEASAAAIRVAASEEGERIVTLAHGDADNLMADTRRQAEHLVTEAEEARERVLADLSRRRLVATTQVEQLRAGRERLLDAYRTVRRTLDEVMDDLQRADAEARAAADAVGRRLSPDAGAPAPELAVVEESAPAESAPVESAPAGDERRSSSLRIVRSVPDEVAEAPTEAEAFGPDAEAAGPDTDQADQPADAEPEPLDVVEPTSPDESVRVLRPEPTDAEADRPRQVDEVFARLRAERSAEATAPPEDVPAEAGEATDASAGDGPEAAVSDADELLLQQRDGSLERIETSLARRLKRALQDEQNEMLDRLRGLKANPSAETLLPAADVHAQRYAAVGRDLLGEAARAGAASVSASGPAAGSPALEDLAGDLAVAIVEPLRRRLERAFADGVDDDRSLLADRLGAAYREWKTQRIEQVAADQVVAAHTRGVFAALGPGAGIRWVVCDVEGACPDCDDNALAGTIVKGEAFPTGQLHPPAHAGCHCLIVVEPPTTTDELTVTEQASPS